MSDAAPPADDARSDGISLSHLARSWPKTVLAVWLAAIGLVLVVRGSPGAQGEVEALLPVAHRSLVDEPLVLLELGADGGSASSDALLTAATAIAERIPDERVPLAPPSGEAAAWFDAHALYLMPDEALAEIAARFSDAAMSDAISGLRARMSSPLFGATGDEPRRDPLGLHELVRDGAGRFTLDRARVTAAGDLIAEDGTAVLVQLRSPRPADTVLADVRAAIAGMPVEANLVGPAHLERAATTVVDERGHKLVLITLGAIAAVLAAALRRIRATFAILACLGTTYAAVLAVLGTETLWNLPIVVLAAGFACEGALHLQRISARGWPAATVMACALLPLLLSPYPAWQQAAWVWSLSVAAAILVLRVVLPAFHAVFGGAVSWDGRGFASRARPVLAIVTAGLALALGAWGFAKVPYHGADRIALPEAATGGVQARLLERFFDPALVVRTESTGKDAAEALEHAAVDAKGLLALVPEHATRVDTPGSWVAQTSDLHLRKTALVELQLSARLIRLRETLEAQGFRADAFGEFLRSAGGDEGMPTADAMLHGSLGPWLRRYLEEGDGLVRVRAFLQLVSDPAAPLPKLVSGDGKPLPMLGPAAAARSDRDRFAENLGMYALCQLWLGAFVVWLGTRSFAIALSAALATLATLGATLALVVIFELPFGPAMVPGWLLAGAAATVAAGRSCRAVDLQRPMFVTGLLVTSLCQIAAGLALVVSPVPMWRELGSIVIIGAAVASTIGIVAAPGLCRLLRREQQREEQQREETQA